MSIVLALVILSDTLRAYANIIGAPHSIALWDFKLFYSGDLDFFAGGSLYRPAAVLPFPRISISPNNNSPVGALIFLPFSRLPLPVAALVGPKVAKAEISAKYHHVRRRDPTVSVAAYLIGTSHTD